MADISIDIASWSGTAGSNSPSGGTVVGTGLDDNLRAMQAAVVLALSAKGSDIASATPDLSATNGLFHDITGTTAITALGTVRAGIWKVLKFEGALTFTHNATSLIIPGGANITTADGDMCMVTSEGSGNWRVNWYVRANGSPVSLGGAAISALTEDTAPDLGADYIITYDASAGSQKKVLLGRAGTGVLGTEQAATSGTSIDFTGIPAWAKKIFINFNGVSTNSTSALMLQLGDAGGVETSGYANRVVAGSTSATSGSTSGFLLTDATVAANAHHGTITLVLEDASDFTWCMTATIISVGGEVYNSGGSKATSAALDRVRITTAGGADTFDAGAINILYE